LIIVAILVITGCSQIKPLEEQQGALNLPTVFGDHMVLQRDIDVPVWGWATPGSRVTIEMNGHTSSTLTTPTGEWRVGLPPMKAGGPYELVVKGTETVQFQNVMVGEVWLCSGQSNMGWMLRKSEDAQEEIARADTPNLRLFRVGLAATGWPASDVEGTWLPCVNDSTATSNSIAAFSAVAYFFGQNLHEELDVPVGLIQSAWGGTLIEPWTPPIGFASVSALLKERYVVGKANGDYQKGMTAALEVISRNPERWITAARAALEEGRALPPGPAFPGHALSSRHHATTLYNGMIHPLAPFALRGAIWYQGESNRGSNFETGLYQKKMRALINGWRTVWDQGDFPFYFAQLAPYAYTEKTWTPEPEGAEYALPLMWEAQLDSLIIPNTGMAVITDVGDLTNIHPARKKPVGERLARWVLAKNYGKDIVYSGPLYREMTIEDNRIRLHFDHAEGLKSSDGEPLTWFEVAGSDKEYIAAEAQVDGDTIIVWSAEIAEPAAARFGWHEEAEPNLVNGAGLPASPFRTHR